MAAISIPELPTLTHSGVFRPGWISLMMCGKSGCGKTRLMAELVPSISPQIRFICIATHVYRNPFHLAVKDWATKQKRVCVILDDPTYIEQFVKTLHEKRFLVPGRQELLVIFDDFSINRHSKSKDNNLVIEAFTRWRNLGVNFVVVCQDATMVAPSCRNCTNMRILFNSASRDSISAFSKDIVDRVADYDTYANLIRYITSIPYSYILIRENPLELSVGKGMEARSIMTDHSVDIPTYGEIMQEIGAGSPCELDALTRRMQKRMGNTAPQLTQRRAPEQYPSLRSTESDSDSSAGEDSGETSDS